MFKGRRAPAGILFMVLVTLSVLVYWFNPAGNPTIDMMALVAIGFLIYGPVMLIGSHALELAPKKAAGTRQASPACSVIWVARSRPTPCWAIPLTTSAGTAASWC